VLTEEKLTDIQAKLQLSLRKSLWRLAQETDVAYTTAHRATKLLGFRPYRIQEVHRIKHTDLNLRITFCNWLLHNVHNGISDPNLFFMSDEAWFHVSGYVNAQNSRIWDTKNPHVLHQRPLHDIKVGVWCAVSAWRVIGPIFFEDAVNSDRYVSDILEPFFQELTEKDTRYGYFQQDSATAHTARNSMQRLWDVFDDEQIISQGLWPPHSPDLSICDFHLWGNLKGKVYKNNPWTAYALKTEIRNTVRSINGDELQRVFRNLMTRCEACIREHGDHFQHLLWFKICFIILYLLLSLKIRWSVQNSMTLRFKHRTSMFYLCARAGLLPGKVCAVRAAGYRKTYKKLSL
jgi:hypothetical protein